MYQKIKKALACLMVAALTLQAVNTGVFVKTSETVYAGDQNAPATLSFSQSGNAKTITWSAVNGATGYNIYRSNSRYGTYSRVATVTTTSYTDNTAGSYYYKVRTQFGTWESGDSDPISYEIQLFGDNVYIFDTNDDANQVQSLLSTTWEQQETNQFGSERYAFLFKPGTYSSTINPKVGYYTHVAGLGVVPTDTTINSLTCDATWLGGDDNHNATCNFWRMAENLQVNSSTLWAVSQAVSLRRMKINGNLYLHDNGGWASGGFLADSVITGSTESGSQQQWLSRNTRWNYWTGQNWNMVFVGIADNNTPAEQWWDGKITRVAEAPVVQEKPFLTYDNNVGYRVFVPERRYNASGTSWENGVSGEYIDINDFYVAKEGVDNADTINAALAQGKHLLLTPGIYYIDKAIEVKNPNTIVLGIGLASLQSTNGNACIKVSDVDGVKIAGLLFDAGASNSATLLQVGETASSESHADNPIVLSDVFFRVGGFLQSNTAAETCVIINSNDVIGDNFWVWRADHGNYVSWWSNTTKNGIVVNGDNVTIYALMVEHFHQYQTVWNGNGGRTYFYQSEIPYDVPNQSSWMNGVVNGYASYKVADDVTSHEAYGLGMYLYNRDAAVTLNSVMEVPDTTGVKVHNICSVMLTGNPGIDHVINNTGGGVYTAGARQFIIDYGSGVCAPTIIPGNECYNKAQEVVLTTTTKGATIKYTIDGSTPSRSNGITYTGPFTLSSNATVKAMAYLDGQTDSVVNSQEITVNDIAVGKSVSVSSTVAPGSEPAKAEYTADKVVDGNKSLNASRWESEWSDSQWLTVDLEKKYNLSNVKLTWETAAALAYTIEVSEDNVNWTTIQTVTNGTSDAVLDVNANNATARYIRVNMTDRVTEYGYSLYELEAYGTLAAGETEEPTEEETTASTSTGKCDLIVIDICTDKAYYTGEEVLFTATIKNIGTAATPSNTKHGLGLAVDGTAVSWSDTYMGPLQPGEETTLTMNWGPNSKATWTATSGAHTVSAHVNDTLDVEEADTTNNVYSESMTFTSNPLANDSPNYLSVGYLPNYSYSAYETLDFEALTHLCIAFVNPDTSGNFSSGMSDSVMNAIIKKAHNSGVKVMASLGGYGYADNYAALITPENVEMLCDNLIAYCKQYNIDGIDIDVEGDAPYATWENYENWIYTLRQKCDENNLLLTTAVAQWYADYITDTAFSYFDYIMLMEYDCSASSYPSRLNYWLNTRGIEPERLVLGVPFYCSDGSSYKNILAAYPDAWQNGNSGGIAHDTLESMAAKAELAKNYAGIMIWELSQDTTGEYSLLKSIRDTLYDGKVAYRDGTVTGDVVTIPGTIDVSKYSDCTSGITITTESGVTYAGNLTNGSYLEYTANVQEAGTYTLEFKFAAGDAQYNAENILVKVNGTTVATVPVQASSSWTTFVSHTATVKFDSAGTYTLSLVSDGGACNIANFTATKVQETVTEEPTTKPESVAKVEINGCQISTTVEGYRVIYSVSDANSEVENAGLIYGLADYSTTSDMVIGNTNSTVYSYQATEEGKTDVIFSEMENAQSYTMTMKFIRDAAFYSAGINIRAYAKLKDGSYIYSDVQTYSVYEIADYLYKNQKMNTLESHNYLYENILSVVDSKYSVVDYEWNNVIIKPDEI